MENILALSVDKVILTWKEIILLLEDVIAFSSLPTTVWPSYCAYISFNGTFLQIGKIFLKTPGFPFAGTSSAELFILIPLAHLWIFEISLPHFAKCQSQALLLTLLFLLSDHFTFSPITITHLFFCELCRLPASLACSSGMRADLIALYNCPKGGGSKLVSSPK